MTVKSLFGIVMIITVLVIMVSGCGEQLDKLIIASEDDGIEYYRSRQAEIALVDLNTLSRLTEQIIASEPDLSDTELRAKLFDELVKLKESSINDDVAAAPYIPGYGYRVTWDEFWLLFYNPRYIFKTNEASNDALSEARRRWPGYAMVDDEADAFRHAYWNILLAKRIALWWAIAFTTAHESESSGLAKYMDLHNNEAGREIYLWNQGKSERELSDKTKDSLYKRVTTVAQINVTGRNTLVYLK